MLKTALRSGRPRFAPGYLNRSPLEKLVTEDAHHEGHEEHEGMEFEDLSNRVIGCAIEVHRELGPALLESAYEQSLAHELQSERDSTSTPASTTGEVQGRPARLWVPN